MLWLLIDSLSHCVSVSSTARPAIYCIVRTPERVHRTQEFYPDAAHELLGVTGLVRAKLPKRTIHYCIILNVGTSSMPVKQKYMNMTAQTLKPSIQSIETVYGIIISIKRFLTKDLIEYYSRTHMASKVNKIP